uniref:ATP synthase complex subunit 8 n=1 Tax=Pyrops viridirostris TaxID=2930515 RepID=A0A9E8JYP6_PYRVI|nr:ATP synthase F0 subunit 8 [Pyrops viridirostris]UZT27067.1 ATP synthase F0 subunit 8 [Pyrops viridirostris]
MPQMSPMMWNLLLMCTSMTIMMIMTNMYFMTEVTMEKKKMMIKNKKSMNWKW